MSEEYKQIVRDVNAAFEAGNYEGFLDACSEDIKWSMAGEKSTSGKQEIRDWMGSMGADCEPPQIRVTSMIAEGTQVACYGDMTMKDKDGAESDYAYCDLYRFDGDGKIAELNSFVTKLKTESEQTASAA